MHKTLFIFLFSAATIVVSAQKKDAVLLNINGQPVYTSEFKRVYLKNIDLVKDESQKDIDQYLNLFVDYKLKLNEALALELDKNEKYIKEFEGYKKQLASGYLTDNEVSEQLVKEAYDRMKKRVNASHILLQVTPNAAPKDTLEIYNKISKIRDSIVNGGNFNEIAKRNSEDPSAKDNGGDLGWFSAFRMVYPFEDAAFSTEVGEVSMPFRTRFGYHILKVNDKEASLGEVTVAHIMIATTPEVKEEEAHTRIKDIKKQLDQGASFEALAKEYSDDKNTAVNGGKMNKFGQGVLNAPEFEKKAFALQTPGEISEPVKTDYGWHIIKLIEKNPLEEYDKLKGELTQKIKRDSRSQIITNSFTNKLKKKYNLVSNKEAVEYFKNNVPVTVFDGNWQPDSTDTAMQKTIFSLKTKKYSYGDFAKYIQETAANNRQYQNVAAFIEDSYKNYETKELLSFHEENLENDNEDFAKVLVEYRDGLLLFDLMETKVWNAAKTDSIALQKFYEANKEAYVKEKSYQIVKASSTDQEVIADVEKLFNQGLSKEAIEKNLTEAGKAANVIWLEEEVEEGNTNLTKKLTGKENEVVSINEGDLYTVLKVIKINPKKIKSFEEIKGKVISDYQEEIEKKWMQELREKYEVKVNKRTLKAIKKELNS
ncbi:peptidylprolyl isomerase [Aquimarina sp. ERC-38]|uniref:peptidylprolyl isomerase n=1 Tax=Aquimarina sp. ERC-38 TaxID=2949996 RepID=UPI002248425F|nr:peptidylprolyl isomerase [Aquimarina sp. ERC-38]UZO80424.1 peptidylprolyl isomerase [Aquimarina sp. ERC-38]